jgi:hypothetical protein
VIRTLDRRRLPEVRSAKAAKKLKPAGLHIRSSAVHKIVNTHGF